MSVSELLVGLEQPLRTEETSRRLPYFRGDQASYHVSTYMNVARLLLHLVEGYKLALQAAMIIGLQGNFYAFEISIIDRLGAKS